MARGRTKWIHNSSTKYFAAYLRGWPLLREATERVHCIRIPLAVDKMSPKSCPGCDQSQSFWYMTGMLRVQVHNFKDMPAQPDKSDCMAESGYHRVTLHRYPTNVFAGVPQYLLHPPTPTPNNITLSVLNRRMFQSGA